jgi:putative hydrolase of the HAD superfamily
MVRITGLNAERFAELFWAGRPAYDEGKVTGMGFWRWFQREAGMAADEAQAAELNRWDARLWTVENRVMVAWQEALKARGLQTAILSNMGDNVLESVERAFQWIQRFDLRVWSYQEGVAKPDAAIYRLALERLGARAEETLFIDDKRANVEAARALGIMAIEYESVEGLRRELMARGMDRELPLPG